MCKRIMTAEEVGANNRRVAALKTDKRVNARVGSKVDVLASLGVGEIAQAMRKRSVPEKDAIITEAQKKARKGHSAGKNTHALLVQQIRDSSAMNAIAMVSEHRFHPVRMWRFDIAFVHYKVAVEIDGGNRMVRKGVAVGRHTKDSDYEKINTAQELFWRVLRFSPAMVKSGIAIRTIERVLVGEEIIF